MKNIYQIKTTPAANPENIVCGKNYRFTILTPALVRMEYSENGRFTDAPTQCVLHRDFPKTTFTVEENEDALRIDTGRLLIEYDKKPFSATGLYIHLKGLHTDLIGPFKFARGWHYGEVPSQLGGTARTLDTIDGACPLEPGLMSARGYSLLDDSRSLLLREDGFVDPRPEGTIDLYFFGYGHDYRACLQDFYRLSGATPMLPRFTLGNWWSRYYAYSEESYRALMDRFAAENIPFSVAVIDMDWHMVKIDPKYGSGWTGYTWNPELFPDPERFLSDLHRRGMKTTLNLHPAEGVAAHEKAYPTMAASMGIDPASEETVLCDVSDPTYLENYFEHVLHPMEDEGVDFWWIDWQQGTRTKIPGLDPLWMWNHYHYLDSARTGARPLTFSRYAGPGSHRYPIGFSGDTVITWESLAFQPYFTNTAANIGYGWWSHDIGGHMQGYKDDELEVRWYQYGVFSPINRLHSTSSEFNGKEPWRFGVEACGIMKKFLRLRHEILPYLYTMNYRAWKDGLPLCEPMYYAYPENAEAYSVGNQYSFGTQLIAAPITTPRIKGINLSAIDVWLPDGEYYDVFTDRHYRGGRKMRMYRPLDTLPLLAKSGAIIPMTDKIGAVDAASNPDTLRIEIYPGADGAFTMYEDDGNSTAYEQGACAFTSMKLDWAARRFSIASVEGDAALVPQTRAYTLRFHAIDAATATVALDGKETDCTIVYDAEQRLLTVQLDAVAPQQCVCVQLPESTQVAKQDRVGEVFDFLNAAQIDFGVKDAIYRIVSARDDLAVTLSRIIQMQIDQHIKDAVLEILTA